MKFISRLVILILATVPASTRRLRIDPIAEVLYTCIPYTFSWSGGKPGFQLDVQYELHIEGIRPVVAHRSGRLTTRAYTWTPLFASNDTMRIVITDGDTNKYRSETFTLVLQGGPDSPGEGCYTEPPPPTTTTTQEVVSVTPYTSSQRLEATPYVASSVSSTMTEVTESPPPTSPSPPLAEPAPVQATPKTTGSNQSNAGPVAAGVATGVGISALSIVSVYMWRKRRASQLRSKARLDLNESTLSPTLPSVSSKAALLQTEYSYSPRPSISSASGVYLIPDPDGAKSRSNVTVHLLPPTEELPDRSSDPVESGRSVGQQPAYLVVAIPSSGQESDSGIRIAGGPAQNRTVQVGAVPTPLSDEGTASVPPPYRQYTR
ncbi:hypothetical protein C8Q76DRAFT_743848 [Earliella scabrosa]|nr:hypothetical protein C8Q76DRAFT_743848 [Earliella scabrosa]